MSFHPTVSVRHPGGSPSPAHAGARGLRQALGAVAIVAAVLSLAIAGRLAAYGGNLTGFIQFGARYAAVTHPPPGALVLSPDGYDGQFFYVQGQDPLLLHDFTVGALRAGHEGFRLQRVGYPALAFVLSAGRAGALPFALLAANVLVLLGLAAGLAVYARRRGWSTLMAVAIALMPGMVLATLRDLSDPLAVACVVAGLLLWQVGRRWPAAVALAVAALTRELMIVAVAAVAADALIRCRQAHGEPGAWRAIVTRAWPVVAVPASAFAVWQAYVMARYGGPVGGAALSGPIVNMVAEVRASLRVGIPLYAAWDLVYVVLIAAAVAAALWSVCRRATLTSLAACALAVGVLVPTFGDVWSDTRLSAPLFAVLLIDGLERRDRRSVLICAGAASMTLLVPFAIPGTF